MGECVLIGQVSENCSNSRAKFCVLQSENIYRDMMNKVTVERGNPRVVDSDPAKEKYGRCECCSDVGE